jgi:hypothetical protein
MLNKVYTYGFILDIQAPLTSTQTDSAALRLNCGFLLEKSLLYGAPKRGAQDQYDPSLRGPRNLIEGKPIWSKYGWGGWWRATGSRMTPEVLASGTHFDRSSQALSGQSLPTRYLIYSSTITYCTKIT